MYESESEERFLRDYRILDEYRDRYESYIDRYGKEEQRRNYAYVLRDKNHVQAFVNNIAAPKSLEELQFYIHEHGCFNVEDILRDPDTNWTVPGWTKPGDIVFFMHSKTARTSLTALRSNLKAKSNMYSSEEYNLMMEWIERGLTLHAQYGGRIFAVGQVASMPEHEDISDDLPLHWHSRTFADIDSIEVLSNPIDISQFRSFLQISRVSGITPVFGTEYRQLKELICLSNDVSPYFKFSDATPTPLTKINRDNWIAVSAEFRHSFFLECQFRTYFVDYLLHCISDTTTIFRECRCEKAGIPDSFVDNVIWFHNRLLPVEVKLSVPAQTNIIGQVSKYCEDDIVHLSGKRLANMERYYLQRVLIIDTDTVYMYNHCTQCYNEIFDLDCLKNYSDIEKLESAITNAIQ